MDQSLQTGGNKSEADLSEEVRLRKPWQKGDLPIAKFMGKPIQELPQDLYIPPEVLEVFLEAFEGPLDLLLYLVKRNNMDILDVQVSKIMQQYMHYIDMMQKLKFELAAEYLLMAVTLAEIKSRMLLPRPPKTAEEDEGIDPRAELIRRLQEYERFKVAAENLDQLPRQGRDIYPIFIDLPVLEIEPRQAQVSLHEMLQALRYVMSRQKLYESHHVAQESLSTRERMSQVLIKLRDNSSMAFIHLFDAQEGKLGAIVTFLALMELVKESLIDLVQTENYGRIYVKIKSI